MAFKGNVIWTRDHLNSDALIALLRERLAKVVDKRRATSVTYPMVDVLVAAFAMFGLKDPSLLAFQARTTQESLLRIFGIQALPSDTQMREILDGVELDELNECFADIFAELQRGGLLRQFEYLDGQYLMAIDGTGFFCSTEIHCPSCLERKSSSGEVHYHHQAVAAVLIHPTLKIVIPLAIEPIVKQDGDSKNDCERNATYRLLKRVRRQHPKLKLIVTEDGLSSNAPHIRQLRELKMSYILGAKPGDHKHLFEAATQAIDQDRMHSCRETVVLNTRRSIDRETLWVDDLPLNATHQDLRVNYLQQCEFDSTGKLIQQFTWVTDLKLTPERAVVVARGGRCRWKIENETFNTLKNQGYHFEHNYGHGQKNLCNVLATLMMLAFLVDQVQQLCCPLFKAVLASHRTRKLMWENIRGAVKCFVVDSFMQLYRAMLDGQTENVPLRFH